MRKSKLLIVTLVAGIACFVIAGVAYAAFTDKGKITGSSFSIGSGDIKLVKDVTKEISSDNLTDELTGPTFLGITPNWTKDYLVKIYNNATTKVNLTSNSNYATANDPEELRSIIFVEPIEWNDTNANGIIDTGEEGTSLGKKSITKWKTEGYTFGQINSGSTKSLILRFSTDSVSSTKQGKSGIFDFEIDAVQVE